MPIYMSHCAARTRSYCGGTQSRLPVMARMPRSPPVCVWVYKYVSVCVCQDLCIDAASFGLQLSAWRQISFAIMANTECIPLALMRPASCTGSFINHTQMRVNLYQPSAN